MEPYKLENIKNITISGRIASGTTTLAHSLSEKLGWDLLEGGALFEKIHNDMNIHEMAVDQRPDSFDIEYEDKIKHMLKDQENQIIQSHLAGFDAKDISGVFKILVVVENEEGEDMKDIRIDRLVNRKKISVDEAKEEIRKRESNNLDKWRRLYADNDPNWIYFDPKYYDLIVNTFSHDKNDSLEYVLDHIGYKKT